MLGVGWLILLTALLGAVLGSFLNVLVIRIKESSSLWGRSHCPQCQHTIPPHHLVPILSWLMLRGRCGFCHRHIHVQYPLVELAMACLTAITALRYDFLLTTDAVSSMLFEILFLATLLVLTVFDLRWKLLPMEFMTGSIIVFAVWNILRDHPSVGSMLIGALVGAVFLGAQFVLSRGKWMGGGDPIFGILIGIALGWPLSGYALYLTYMGGGLLMGLFLLVGIVKRGSRIPFGPMLAAGATLSLWFGPMLHRIVREWWIGG